MAWDYRFDFGETEREALSLLGASSDGGWEAVAFAVHGDGYELLLRRPRRGAGDAPAALPVGGTQDGPSRRRG